MQKSIYRDRTDAAMLLADQLKHYKNTNTIILAIPRGGVPIGFLIANALHLPLEITMAKKIGHPDNPEYAVGAVSLYDTMVDEEVSSHYIQKETQRIKEQLSAKLQYFMDGRQLTGLAGKNVIVVDDGIATGRTLMACVKSIRRQHPARLIVAAPVASSSAAHLLQALSDEFVCPLVSSAFYAVGQFYEQFDQVSDERVKAMLAQAAEGWQQG